MRPGLFAVVASYSAIDAALANKLRRQQWP